MKNYRELIIHAAEEKFPGNVGPGLLTAVTELNQLYQMALAFQERGLDGVDIHFQKLFISSEFFTDFQWYVAEILEKCTAQAVRESLAVHNTQGGLVLYVGQDQHWLLQISRNVGLLKLSSLRRLKALNVKVIGSSVAAATAELLVDLGCQQIDIIDDGVLEPSNIPRLPMGDISTLGKSKCQVLVERLRGRSPHGSFIARSGRVIPCEADRKLRSDVLIDDFVQGADLLIEVIDDIRIKSILHTETLRKHPRLPLLFIADLGTRPKVCLVRHDDKQPFGRVWSEHESAVLDRVKGVADRTDLKHAAYFMVKEALPNEHLFQFTLNADGVMPYWSQTAIASRLSAAHAALTVLELCGGVTYTDLQSEDTFTVCQNVLGI